MGHKLTKYNKHNNMGISHVHKRLTVTNLNNRQSTITWVSHMFTKTLTKTVTCEFVSDT